MRLWATKGKLTDTINEKEAKIVELSGQIVELRMRLGRCSNVLKNLV